MSSGPGLSGAFFLLAVRRLRSFRATRRYSARGRRTGIRVAPVGLVVLGLAGCATAIESGPPITGEATSSAITREKAVGTYIVPSATMGVA